MTQTEKDKKIQELKNRFSYHKPDEQAVKRMNVIRSEVQHLALSIEFLCPESREKSTALTQLSFVMMSANAAIAMNCPIDESDL